MAPSIKLRYERSPVTAGLQAYGLKITALESTDMPKEIFIMRRDVVPFNEINVTPDPHPENPGIASDTFICLADPVDLEEIPVDVPDINNEMPYYRVAKVEFWFRTSILLEETYDLIAADVTKLVESLVALSALETTSEVTYG